MKVFRVVLASAMVLLATGSTPPSASAAQRSPQYYDGPIKVTRVEPVGWDADMQRCTGGKMTRESLTRCNAAHPLAAYPKCTTVEIWQASDTFRVVESTCPNR